MRRRIAISQARDGRVILSDALLCDSFWRRLRGLLACPPEDLGRGALFICHAEGRLVASVHTLGLRRCIGLVWLDARRVVVDLRVAPPWQLPFSPSAPAMYCLEGEPAITERLRPGDQLVFSEALA